jgi:hypothetical protein
MTFQTPPPHRFGKAFEEGWLMSMANGIVVSPLDIVTTGAAARGGRHKLLYTMCVRGARVCTYTVSGYRLP